MENSSSSSSSDEEILQLISCIERPRRYRERDGQYSKYGDAEFRERFRLTKENVNCLIELIGDNIKTISNRKNSLSVTEQFLVTLRFYATGSFQILIGDDCDIHKTTVCRVIQKVTREIAKLSSQFIHMPQTEDEIRIVKAEFYNIRQFPNVIGCLDGSHVPIQSPGGENAELFRNRKGYFSINVQAVCNAKLVIQDIVARWPGSTHDSTMFNSSFLFARLEANEYQGGYLLGDSAYSCKEYLLTPLLNPTTVPETNYNNSHIQTRNTIERTFGVWKRRFACLSLGLRTKIETTLEVIVATAVLHNIAILKNDYFEANNDQILNDVVVEQNDINPQNNVGGNALRRSVIDNYFSDL